MKKLFVLFLFSILAVSCAKSEIQIKGKVTNAAPLERIEIIEGSGVATLPLINMGLNDKGEFSGTFTAEKDGMYALTYGGKMTMLYLKKGQDLNITGDGATFPEKYVITGEAKNNNELLSQSQKYFDNYASKINVQELLTKDEGAFLKDFEKIKNDLQNNVKETAKKLNADDAVFTWKKDETNAKLLGLLSAYEENHPSLVQKPDFKVSQKFRDVEKQLTTDQDRMVRELPVYRDYLLRSMNADFQKFATAQNAGPDTLLSDIFAKFLETKKDLSQTAKDYLMAYVIAQSDLNPANADKTDEITAFIDKNIKDANVKEDLKKIKTVILGLKKDTPIPQVTLLNQKGKKGSTEDLKGKPTVVMFYASWNPMIAQNTIPVLKEVDEFYKSKINFAFINLDDTQEQFKKTSASLLKGIEGQNYYAPGGLKSDLADKFGIYGFKLPSFLVLDKNNKIASRPFFNLADPEFAAVLEKLSGLRAPVAPAQEMPGMLQDSVTAQQSADAKK